MNKFSTTARFWGKVDSSGAFREAAMGDRATRLAALWAPIDRAEPGVPCHAGDEAIVRFTGRTIVDRRGRTIPLVSIVAAGTHAVNEYRKRDMAERDEAHRAAVAREEEQRAELRALSAAHPEAAAKLSSLPWYGRLVALRKLRPSAASE